MLQETHPDLSKCSYLMSNGEILDSLDGVTQTRKFHVRRYVYAHEDSRKSQTQQHFKDECDVNRIVRNFETTGVLPSSDPGIYGDYSEVPDFLEAQNIIIRANQQFDGLDARTRARFNNDPSLFLAFCSDKKNGKEMLELGLLQVIPEPQPDPLTTTLKELNTHLTESKKSKKQDS